MARYGQLLTGAQRKEIQPLLPDRSKCPRGGATYYCEADGLGSITSLTAASGSVSQTYIYNSFGKPAGGTGTLTNPFQFTGRERDSGTDLYYYRARYYDRDIGRFISEDLSATSGRENLYEYVGNNPINLYDPTGLAQTKPKQVKPGPNAVFYICCQRGQVKVCDQSSGSYSTGWVLDCMRQHEKQHVQDLTCGGKNPCEGRADGPITIGADEKKTVECSAYRKELECLRPAGLTKDIQDRRKFIQTQIDNYCGGN